MPPAAALVLAQPLRAAEAVPARPNILFILSDGMGYGDIGCFGGRFAPAPNFDRLAHEGIRFTQYYSVSPICSPSRAGLTTGMFPARWNITSFLQTRAGNRGCEQADFLEPQEHNLEQCANESLGISANQARFGLVPLRFYSIVSRVTLGAWRSG